MKINPNVSERGYRFVEEQIRLKNPILPSQLLSDVDAKLKKAYDEEYYYRKQLSSSTLSEIITASDKKANAIINFDQGIVPDGVAFACVAIQIRFGFHPTETNPAKIRYSANIFDIADVQVDATASLTHNAVPVQRIPNEIATAEYRIRLNGETVVCRGLIESHLIDGIFNPGVIGAVDNIVEVRVPFLCVEKQRLQFGLYLGEGCTLPPGNTFIKVGFFGVAVGDRIGNV